MMAAKVLPCDSSIFCISWQKCLTLSHRRLSISFGIYAIGYLILIGGVAYLAHLLRIPQHYIIAGAVILLGIGIVTGVTATRQKDPN